MYGRKLNNEESVAYCCSRLNCVIIRGTNYGPEMSITMVLCLIVQSVYLSKYGARFNTWDIIFNSF